MLKLGGDAVEVKRWYSVRRLLAQFGNGVEGFECGSNF
jgi:hypothetical protein